MLLDRDGTLIVDRHYLADPQGVELLPGVGAGLRQMRELGLGLVVITNQSGVGRGYFTLEQVEQVHQRLGQLLAVEQVQLDGIYSCPHTPADGCSCRKPATGLVEKAASELDFEPQSCFVVGDRLCDVELGRRIGATTFLVRGETGQINEGKMAMAPDYLVAGVGEVGAILAGLLN
ncbi:MAG: HAD family hydrolase [Candidatus Omnitrophica bacterium]|nr:HAD family hydrolase [Candidatus Omnitrophota bacterium]